MKPLRHAVKLVATVAFITALTACGGEEAPQASSPSSAPTSPAIAPTTSTKSTATAPTKAAMEQAFVLEAMGQIPELALARAELVDAGQTTCEAFREKPGSVKTLTDNMKAAGQTAEQIKTAKVIAIAAIHNLCTDQTGDL